MKNVNVLKRAVKFAHSFDKPRATDCKTIAITSGTVVIFGNLAVPAAAGGIVIFAHGSGSSRFSLRNTFVAEHLNKAGIATLLIDLLTKEEDEEDMATRRLRFNIALLAQRLVSATEWVRDNAATKDMRIGYFGASTGAAAALAAAAKVGSAASVIVSRGGRPDLAGAGLSAVDVPVLFIVGANDPRIIAINQLALDKIKAKKELVVVPRATHLFKEPGALEAVAELAKEWFLKYLR